MNKCAFNLSLKKKLGGHAGFSYLEMMMVVFILALSTGVITDTLNLGVKHLRQQTKNSQAIILLNTLSAVIRNDLIYATGYLDGGFISTTKEIKYALFTQYGTGEWIPEDMMETAWTLGEGEAYDSGNLTKYCTKAKSIPSGVMKWKACDDTNATAGQIIRRSLIYDKDTKTFSFYYTPLTTVQDYSGYKTKGKPPVENMYATITMSKPSNMYIVTITIYDGPATATAKTLQPPKTFEVIPIQPH